jgi:hypothetical protein
MNDLNDRASVRPRARAHAVAPDEFYKHTEERRGGPGVLYDEALSELLTVRESALYAVGEDGKRSVARVMAEEAAVVVRRARDSDPLGVNVPDIETVRACIALIRAGAFARGK